MTDFGRLPRLGLSSNPFRTLSQPEWGEIAFLTPDIHRLVQQEHAHLQLLGKMGRGKTTTLLGIENLLENQGQSVMYEYLPISQRRFKTNLQIQHPAIFLLDEAQRLWHYEKWRLLRFFQKRPRKRLIFSSHADLSGWFRSRGLPLLTYEVDNLPMSSLGELLHKRLHYFLIDKNASVKFTDDAITYLEAIFGSNRRQMEQFLYEVFEIIQDPQTITAQVLADCQAKVKQAQAAGRQKTQVHRQFWRTWSADE